MKTKDRILESALFLARMDGWRTLTRDSIARDAGCSPSLVSAYYGLMDDLRSEVMRVAVERRIARVVLEGWAARHPATANIDHDLRAEIMLDS